MNGSFAFDCNQEEGYSMVWYVRSKSIEFPNSVHRIFRVKQRLRARTQKRTMPTVVRAPGKYLR